MNGAEWFFLESGRQMGPVPLDQLVTLLKTRLPAGTFVWCDGMADWLKAEDVADLAAQLAPAPAPAPAPAAAPAPPSPAPRSGAAATTSPRTGPGPSSPRPTYRIPASASAPRVSTVRQDDEPYTLNPFALLGKCFRFAGRFDRAQFAIAYVADLAIACGLALGLGLLGASSGRESPSVLLLVLVMILTPLIVGIALGASVRRLHDLGQPGWYVLVSLLPCLGFLFLLYLLVAPGSASAAAAPSSSKAVPALLIAVVLAVVAIPVLGIVAAIAIPSLLRARVSANEAAAI
ncbi:MAG TPA: DUF805 domain-containing protein, partial [Vicinamibacteria bacterium]|nr:DUF805 domain-containing protein [Vicinamibacteria bacterium]